VASDTGNFRNDNLKLLAAQGTTRFGKECLLVCAYDSSESSLSDKNDRSLIYLVFISSFIEAKPAGIL
jgi:hypothetical protein